MKKKTALLVIIGKQKGEIFLLEDKDKITVGRGGRCEIKILDPSVSRCHFSIIKEKEGLFLQDMGSANGTFINGRSIRWKKLNIGDIIQCGSTCLKLINIDEKEIEKNKINLSSSGAKNPFKKSSPTQALQQINPSLISENLNLLNQPSLTDTPTDIIFKKSRRELPFGLYKDSEKLRKALAVLYKISELLHTELDLKKLLEVLLEKVMTITKAERGCILLKKSSESELEIAAFKSKTNPISMLTISKTIVNLAINQGVATVSSDAMKDIRFKKDEKSSVVLHNIRAVMCVPLEGCEKAVGAIYVDSPGPSAFNDEDLELLTAIGRQAGLLVERTLLQENIIISEQKYRTIFEKAPVGIMLVNQSGRIMDINPAGLKEIEAEENIIGEYNIKELFPKAIPYFQKLLFNGKPFDIKELHTNNFRGESVIVNLKGIPLFNEDGEIDGAIIISEDITESKKLQAQLIQQDKMATVGLLAAGIAHEFNNILAGMLGYAQLTQKKSIDSEKLAQIVIEQCKRAKEVISKLLDFSRRKDIPSKFINLENLLEDVFSLVKREFYKHNIKLVKNFEKVPPIKAQPGEIQQVFLNLVLNAMHAIGENGTLTVSLKYEDNKVKIIFEDTGVGIPPHILPRIFEPFFTTKEKKGTGLGLTVTYNIVKSYGGEILVESKEGKGTKFTIELPAPTSAKSCEIDNMETEKLEAEAVSEYLRSKLDKYKF